MAETPPGPPGEDPGRSVHGLPSPKRRVGRYEVLRQIGRGGMATVYMARQIQLERNVALKELSSFHASSSEFAERFLRESRLAGSLNHPNIVTVFEYFEEEGTPYIAMEYVAHGSLRPYVGRLALQQFAGVMEGILAGLAHAETYGIVHRDLKPENIMVTGDGRVKITDFGIAKATQRAGTGAFLTATGTTVGTPTYMAPEQAMAQDIGMWTDLYSVGVMAYEHVVGRVPFYDTEAPMMILMRHVNEPIPAAIDVNPQIDRELSEWIDRLLVKDPRERTQTAVGAWDELEEIILRLLGPRWRRQARLPEHITILDTPRPLTPAPFQSTRAPTPPPMAQPTDATTPASHTGIPPAATPPAASTPASTPTPSPTPTPAPEEQSYMTYGRAPEPAAPAPEAPAPEAPAPEAPAPEDAPPQSTEDSPDRAAAMATGAAAAAAAAAAAEAASAHEAAEAATPDAPPPAPAAPPASDETVAPMGALQDVPGPPTASTSAPDAVDAPSEPAPAASEPAPAASEPAPAASEPAPAEPEPAPAEPDAEPAPETSEYMTFGPAPGAATPPGETPAAPPAKPAAEPAAGAPVAPESAAPEPESDYMTYGRVPDPTPEVVEPAPPPEPPPAAMPAPAAEAPPADEPVVDEPRVEEPRVEEPPVEVPPAQEPEPEPEPERAGTGAMAAAAGAGAVVAAGATGATGATAGRPRGDGTSAGAQSSRTKARGGHSPRVAARRRLAILALCGAVAAAVIGFLVAPSKTKSSPSGGPALVGSIASGPLQVSVPAGWAHSSAAPPSELPLANHITANAAAASGGGKFVMGSASTNDPTLLPAKFLTSLPGSPSPQTVTLGKTQFYRYLNLTPKGQSSPETVYAVPTTVGTVVAVCQPQGSAATFLSDCERVVASMQLSSGKVLGLGPSSDYGSGLSTAINKLNSQQAKAGAQLAKAKKPADQATAAAALAAAYRQASTSVKKLQAGPATAPNAAIAAALARAGAGYAALGQAAAHNKGKDYTSAKSTISKAMSDLSAGMNQLSKLGYAAA